MYMVYSTIYRLSCSVRRLNETARAEADPTAAAPQSTNEILASSSPATLMDAMRKLVEGGTLAKKSRYRVCGANVYFEKTPADTTETVAAAKYEVGPTTGVVIYCVQVHFWRTTLPWLEMSYLAAVH